MKSPEAAGETDIVTPHEVTRDETEMTMMAQPEVERRIASRRTTLKGGRVAFNAGRSTVDCTVRNLSNKGAKLIVNSVVGIPDTFDLVLSDHSKQACRVIWRSLKELGVEFVATH
jgi:hypothetical protein